MNVQKNKPSSLEIHVPVNVDLKTEDEWKADTFLTGWGDLTPMGLGHVKYLKPNEDRDHRAALVRVLRSDQPLSRTIRKHLAELFDDDSEKSARRLVFEFRHEGRYREGMATRQVAVFVSRRIKGGTSKKVAVADAANQFGISERQVFKYLKAFSEQNS